MFSLNIVAEQAAPAWVPAVALAIPIVIMLLLGVPALRRRSRASAARRAQGERRTDQSVALDSATSIDDPSAYSTGAVLKALAVRPEYHELCERIAQGLRLGPLPAKRIGPAWKVPYGLGRSTTPAYPDS